MAVSETNWQEFLSPDSEIPHDVHFLVKREDDEGDKNDSSRPIGAHKVLLAGVSPVFRRMLFGPLKEEREVIEVRDTTHKAFKTMINYIYKPPGSRFFPTPTGDYEDVDYAHYADYNHPEELNPNVIECPQKFFDLVDLAERYQILSLKEALTSRVIKTLPIKEDNVVFAATVAMKYKIPFEDVSNRMLGKCLKFLLQWKRGKAGEDLWTQFWALVNNSEETLKERLAGTPFVEIHHDLRNEFLWASLNGVGPTSYDSCLFLASSGVHVRLSNCG